MDTPEDLRDLARAICASEPPAFTLDDLHEADRVAKTNPAALTDRQLQYIACYAPQTILALVRTRAEAVQRRADQAFAAAQAHAAEQRRAAAPPTPPIEAASLDDLTLEELVALHPDAPVPLELWMAGFDAMNERNKERNAKIAALEAALQKVQERVLELEAQKAVADGKP